MLLLFESEGTSSMPNKIVLRCVTRALAARTVTDARLIDAVRDAARTTNAAGRRVFGPRRALRAPQDDCADPP